ncbi:tail fiber assembly protein [Escherichia phage vB_EcoM_Goslar]|uniref:Tail fiber assembly protein n=1 Tax=Escherichia phage vB_EcoM_Goslar TaxID=2502409 RepID=A0A482GIC9_BPGOS|nr:tail fiber assembly [Escherichia phage vB_EcoM_Goslar]QBO63882.1 tail fiber assembly protein [Escherichia phage vB_EcoM_Goslar]
MSTLYAVIENGVVVNTIVYDGEAELDIFDNQQLVSISDTAAVSPGIGWLYSNGEFIAPPEPERQHEELVAEAEQIKQSLIDSSLASIDLIQLKLRAGRKLTPEETTRLNAVLDYVDAVSAVDTDAAPNIDWPEFPAAK